jgi:hypothetical protein
MPEDRRKNTGDGRLFWLWVLVAVSSAGYAVAGLLSWEPGAAEGGSGAVSYLLEVVIPIAMCAYASWLGFEAWRSDDRSA